MAVCLTYMSTERRPFWYLASISISTRVPWSLSHSTAFCSWMSGLFFVVSIDNKNSCALARLPGLLTIFIGLPVVSMPYMPAAEMPMPCWPRDCDSLWNFDPYKSLPKTLPTCSGKMPGPLSSTTMR